MTDRRRTHRLWAALAQCGLALAVVASLVSLPPTAEAATGSVTASLSAGTVQVHAVETVSGSVSSHKAGAPVVVQLLSGHTWKALAGTKSRAHGVWSVNLRAPGKSITWSVRASASGLVSHALTVRIVKTRYAVHAATASVVSGSPLVVSGVVSPKAKGSVVLQLRSGAVWVKLASASLTSTSRFTLRAVRTVGSYSLRVVKAYDTKVAAGVSSVLVVKVTAAPAVVTPLSVTTTTLPTATVGLPYAATLSAAGGVPPYRWGLATGTLPAGLSLTTDGQVSGTPTTPVAAALSLTVIDSVGATATEPLVLGVVLSPAANDTVVAWGQGTHGELGNNAQLSRNSPVPVANLTGVVGVAGGSGDGYALRFDGTVWAWGAAAVGQLGDGSSTESPVPVQVSGLTDVTAIAAGGNNGYALRADGTVWAWGFNFDGEDGDGTVTVRRAPVQVGGLPPVKAIAAGTFSAYALARDGTVWSWGSNGYSELGDGTGFDRHTPVQVVGLTSISAIAGGSANGYALRSDGTVVAWGENNHYQLGTTIGTVSATPVTVAGVSGVAAIAASGYAALALTTGGAVFSWEDNEKGGLGNNSIMSSATPGEILTGRTAIGAGAYSGYTLAADGTVSAWGDNDQDQLGDGSPTERDLPVPVTGLTHVIAIGTGSSSLSAYAIVRS